ncbi:MAG TPA: ABC transporter ATP-binding protein [Candidatus Mcinerneyibacteriales bacterium]|nr:ABC transporter ATP-binding protein [Candidatus Mcinerneyibacteriales bacterium]HPQ88713.1 ABC transporter ATP-binding protein [Candidatus Mcinerneyibacteriales bacterium]
MNEIKRLLRYLRGFEAYYPIAIIFMLALSVSQNFLAIIIGQFINIALDNLETLKTIIFLGGINAVILFFSKFGQDYTLNYLSENLLIRLKNDVLGRVLYLPMHFFKNTQSGDILSRLTNDITNIQNFMRRGVVDMIMNTATLLGAIYIMVRMNLRLFLIMMVVLPLIVIIIYFLGIFVKKYTLLTQHLLAVTVSIMQEIVQGIEVIKIFSSERRESQRYRKSNNDYLDKKLKEIRVTALSLPLMEILGYAALLLIFWFGGKDVVEGRMNLGAFITFFVAAGNASTPIRRLSNLHLMVQRTTASASRIFEIMNVENPILKTQGTLEKEAIAGTVTFENVTFSYDTGEEILKDINLHVKKGEVVALVGPSGGGKTTLVNLIPRLYDCTRGAVTIDGTDIRQFKLANLRSHIAMVSQTNFLFSGTIAENIGYTQASFDNEAIIEAAKAAYAHDFIMDLPRQYETEIGERGVKLSGGQKQRIAIARAVLRNPSILIFDEATSALDTESEKYVQDAINNMIKDRTTFIVAHRLSTILHADRIIVIHRGRIEAMGKHDELLEKSSLYRKLYSLQFNN